MVTNGLGRLVVTNGSRISLTGTGQNVRVGSSSPNGEATATNIANIAGTVEFTSGAGSIQIGANCALAELNLLAGGVLRIQGVVPQQTTGIARWNFNGGILSPVVNSATFFEGLTEANVQAGGAMFDTAGFDITVNQSLLDGGGGGGLTKQGAGTLLLNSVNSYTGATLVSGGVLGGNGTIAGPVTVQAAGTLSPGAVIGTLTINNNLTLQGTTFIEVNQDSMTADQVIGVSALTYGGTLVVTNLGTAALTNGSSFQLFTASTRNGAFAAVVPAPGSGLSWDTSRLTVDGTLAVKTGPSTTPTVISAVVTGNQLELSWPADHLGWRLEGQTNSLSVGLSANWSTVPGSTTTNRMSFPVNPAVPTVFFRLVYP
jgi:autotransporter-associated beta strand protein